MRVALLTMTRDRLAYTQHCHASLVENAGCDFDWYVLDQGSTDGTPDWLRAKTDAKVVTLDRNIGICPAANLLLARCDPTRYDVIVRWDNDCEVTQPGTLELVARLADKYGWILAPRVLGLNHPPPASGRYSLDGHTVSETAILGGIFMAIPAWLFDDYRYDETNPPYTGDEAITAWYRARGGRCGYVETVTVNHYETTEGQKATFPEYWERKTAEMAA